MITQIVDLPVSPLGCTDNWKFNGRRTPTWKQTHPWCVCACVLEEARHCETAVHALCVDSHARQSVTDRDVATLTGGDRKRQVPICPVWLESCSSASLCGPHSHLTNHVYCLYDNGVFVAEGSGLWVNSINSNIKYMTYQGQIFSFECKTSHLYQVTSTHYNFMFNVSLCYEINLYTVYNRKLVATHCSISLP